MSDFNTNIDLDLVAAYLGGQLSEAQSAEMQKWIDASQANREEFNIYKLIWEQTGTLNPAPVAVNADAAWEKLNNRIENSEKIISIIPEKKPRVFLKIAAALLPLIIAGSLLLVYFNSAKNIDLVATNKPVECKLSDGTQVNLNKKSKLTYPDKFSGNTREVNLSGEAFFSVAHNAEKPFIIHSGEANVKVLGTSFNVNAFDTCSDVVVEVKTGRVMLFANNGVDTISIILSQGEKGIYNKKTHSVYSPKKSPVSDSYWLNKMMIFDKAELQNALDIISKNYGVQFEINGNDSIKRYHLTASFNNQSIEQVMEVISGTFNLKINRQGNKFVVEENGF